MGSEYEHHFIGAREGGKGRSAIDLQFGVVGVVVGLGPALFLFLCVPQTQTEDLSIFGQEDAGLIAVFVPYQFTAFHADVLTAVVSN